MTWNLQNLKIGAEKISVCRLLDEKIWFDGFDFEREPEAAKEIAIGNHRPGERVTTNFAAKLAFNLRNVLDVIDVTVC